MRTTQTNTTLTGLSEVPNVANDLPMELQQLLMQAADQNASDIHLDSGPARPIIRLRVDGNLYAHRQLDDNDGALRLINQVRVAAGIDIDAIWSPEQGQFRWQWKEKTLDIRVTVAPTAPENMALHMRLLRPPYQLHGLDELGLSDQNLDDARTTLSLPDGLILISGPTGAGKTTTLYAMLDSGLFDDKLIGTVEDPAEFDLPYVRQIEVDHRHDLTMAEGLRTLLRMDPDLLAVGEIRDSASAATTAMAALAGRMVLATLHARDAAGAITALHRMGVPYYILGHALRMVINQQVVRQLCASCAKARKLEDSEARLFTQHDLQPPEQVREPAGCSECHGRGYRGRIGIFQVLPVDRAFGRWLCDGRSPAAIRERILQQDAKSMIADGMQKAASGQTSIAEVCRFFESVGE